MPGANDQSALVYRAPDLDLTRYDKLYLERVEVFTGEGNSELNEEDAHMVAMFLFDAISKELSKEWELVESEDPSTLRVRVALTDAKRTPVLMDVVTTLQGVLRIGVEARAAAGAGYAYVGRAAAEMEVLDGGTGRRLYAAVDERTGTKSLGPGFGEWSDVKAIARVWAKQLATQLRVDRSKIDS